MRRLSAILDVYLRSFVEWVQYCDFNVYKNTILCCSHQNGVFENIHFVKRSQKYTVRIPVFIVCLE